ncbi:MAG: FAD-binding oxidoreductase [Actinobacteria bacterium]|nr:MAG: FAD-binding oxidoreductase [Actinomycetota bacterium]
MEELDRRQFLRRAGGAALAASLAPTGFELVRASNASKRSDPRLRALARELRGPVYAPGSRGYERTHRIVNLRYAGVDPLGVAQPETVADVKACVRWGHRYGVRLVPRSGGHSYAGYSTGRGALQVDMRRMAAVRLDGASGTAAVGPGAQLMKVYLDLAAHGVTIPAGSCPTVGIGGLALGGGYGLASRRFGLTTDNVRRVGIVLADGRHVTASRGKHPDLFWACRGGGGGNFGIVTGFRFRVHSVHDATRFSISWPWDEAEAVVHAWQKWAPHAPDELDSILNLHTDTGSPHVHCVGQYFGSTRRLQSLLHPVTRVGTPSVSMRTQPYGDVQKWLAGCSGETPSQCLAYSPERFAAKSHYFRRPLSSSGRTAIVHAISRAQDLHRSGAVILDAYGGAINRVHPHDTAFVHRKELFSAQLYVSWGSHHAEHSTLKWLRDLHARLAPHASGFAYQNYIDPELASWQHAYYGSNWTRLVDVKRRYDPDDFFHFRQSIPPG